MKIAIDISPLQTGHKVRGVGFYLEYLKASLLENFPEHAYQFFTKKTEVEKDVDVVHYPYFDPFFITLPFVKNHRTVVTVHDLSPLVFPKHFPAGLKGTVKWQTQKFLLKHVDAVIADSQASKHDIVTLAGIPEDKVFVVHLAAAKEFKHDEKKRMRSEKIREKYHLPENFALYVGDVTWNKNVPRIIQAAVKADVPLVMVGKALLSTDFDATNPWNADLVQVQKIAEKHTNIIRLGFVPTEDLVSLYNSASVFVFPSLYEGFGLPVIEAMQAGCPVITSHGGSLKEVSGNAAVIVDPFSVDAIAKEIDSIMHSKALQKELSEKGLEQSSKFSWKETARKTIEVYQSVFSL